MHSALPAPGIDDTHAASILTDYDVEKEALQHQFILRARRVRSISSVGKWKIIVCSL